MCSPVVLIHSIFSIFRTGEGNCMKARLSNMAIYGLGIQWGLPAIRIVLVCTSLGSRNNGSVEIIKYIGIDIHLYFVCS